MLGKHCALPAEKRVDGVYRDLESIPLSMAEFYLQTDPFRKEGKKLRWFGAAKGNFKAALGGDEAPFGKWDESISWLVSFLNVGSRVASPNDNFLLFGANCKETDEVVDKFAKQLKDQIAAIESKNYFIGDLPVTFSCELVPSDIKFLALLNGELSNSAKYFSSFANASTSDLRSLEGDFGISSDCKWKQWDFDDRLSIARKVSAFQQKIPKKLAKSTKRAKVTQFIENQKSRQKFEPLIGKLCDKQVLKPLHLKNNAVQKLHGDLLSLAIARSNLPVKIVSLSELPITRFLDALTHD